MQYVHERTDDSITPAVSLYMFNTVNYKIASQNKRKLGREPCDGAELYAAHK